MKKILALLMTVMLLAGLAGSVGAADSQVWYKLIAGQNYYVGNVGVSIDDYGNLHVVYVAADGYCFNEIHTDAAYNLDDIAQRNGNPVPGQFFYKDDVLDCAKVAKAIIPGPWDASEETPIYVAAHAVVGMIGDPDWEETGWALWCGVDNLDLYAFDGSNWAVYITYTGVNYTGIGKPPAAP